MPISSRPPYDDNNVFARILRGELPSEKLYEDDYALAFRDINPQAPVHALVIPKARYVSLVDFAGSSPAQEISGLLRAVVMVAKELGLEPDGYRVVVNIGRNGHQEVPHLHFHVLGGRQFSHQLAAPAPGAPENASIAQPLTES